MAVGNGQMRLLGGLADHRERAALTLADGLEALEIGRIDGARNAPGTRCTRSPAAPCRFVVGDVAQFETTATATIVDQLRKRVGQAAGTDVVDELDRVVLAQLPAAVDDLLAATFHFRVVALYRGEVRSAELVPVAIEDAAPPPRPISMAGPPSTISGADRNLALLHMLLADVTHAAGEHDRLVIAPYFLATRRVDRLFEGTEVAGQRRTAELVVERGAASGPRS